MVTNRYRPAESVMARPIPSKFGSSGAGWCSRECRYRPPALVCQISISVSGTGRPSESSTRPARMIRCPCGSPAGWVGRSGSVAVIRSSPRSGPVTSVSRCGSSTSGRWGWRSAVERYPAKSSGGCTPSGRSYEGRVSWPDPVTAVVETSVVMSTAPLEVAQRVELGRAGGGDDLRVRGDGQVPAGPLLGCRRGDAGEQAGQGELERHRVGLEDTQIGDDLLRPGSGEPEPFAVPRARPVAHRGDEVHPLHERPAALPDHDDHLTARGRDLWCAARAGQAHPGVLVVSADDGGVDVAELVDLRGTEEPDVDAPRLQPVVEDLGHADHGIG